MRVGRWRAFGTALLVAGVIGVAAGLIETYLADRHVPPGARDLLYGVNLHLLIALLVTLGMRILLWRASDRTYLTLGVVAFLALECGVVGAYWLNTAAFMPPFHTPEGRRITAAAVLGGLVIGILIGLLLVRTLRPETQRRLTRGFVGMAGLILAVVLLIGNGIWLTAARPQRVSAQIREDAEHIERPDVFIILVDTLRRDHLSYFGYERLTTPQIDNLFAQSYVFTQAYTPSSWTIPSVASLFTGLYPSSHGITSALRAIPADAPTLAEHFRSYGYRTGAFVGNMIVTSRNGFSQGFETFFPPEPPYWCYHQRTAVERIVRQLRIPHTVSHGPRLNQELLEWLRRTPGEPHFAFVLYFEPHSPYEPRAADREAAAPGVALGPREPPLLRNYREGWGEIDCNDWECLEDPPRLTEAERAGMIASYDGEIHATDRSVGGLLGGLEELGLLAGSHILFCTDHGEEFFDHGGWFHGNSIYEEMSASPIAYRPPGGVAGGQNIDRPVAQIDVVRSVCSRLPIAPPPMHQGREIPEILFPGSRGEETPVLCELPPHLFSLRFRQWKLIRRGSLEAPEWRLFDLETDPLETMDLSATMPDTLAALRGYLEGLTSEYAQSPLAEMTSRSDPEVLRRLRTLGYVR
jgi:arylsulfatase A-like enzyme